MKYRVRFHLQRGQHYMHWQIKAYDGTVKYTRSDALATWYNELKILLRKSKCTQALELQFNCQKRCLPENRPGEGNFKEGAYECRQNCINLNAADFFWKSSTYFEINEQGGQLYLLNLINKQKFTSMCGGKKTQKAFEPILNKGYNNQVKSFQMVILVGLLFYF